VVPVNYTEANLDDGEVVSDCGIKNEQTLHVNGDNKFISYFLFNLLLIMHQLLLPNRRLSQTLRLLEGQAGFSLKSRCVVIFGVRDFNTSRNG
jgi:hypothetical protein